MKSIYEYLDYRLYLRDYYEDQKRTDPGFSYRIWAERAGFKARDFILRVMRRESRLSGESADALAKAMKLSSAESRYFKEMVRYNQAKTFMEQELCYSRLRRQHLRFKSRSAGRVLTYDYFEFYSEWYHAAIRSLINSYGFDGDYEWLARSVYPAISTSKARKSVALLEKLGLIQRDASGAYHITDADITTGDEVRSSALRRFYGTGMKLMANALDKLSMDRRNISGMTVGISESTYHKIIEKIKTFRQEIAFLAKEEKTPDRVYQVNFHVFPLSTVPEKKRSGK
jgi:uncharacterized protein (TIGR02147 family)